LWFHVIDADMFSLMTPTAPGLRLDNNIVLVIMIVVTLCILTWVLIYFTRRIMMGQQTHVLLSRDVIALNSANYTTISTSNMPDSVNGNTYTYLFWMKLQTFDQTSAHKVLWFRSGGTNDAVGTPVVMLDSSSNRMYVLLATNLTPAGLTFSDIVGKRVTDLRNLLRYAVAVIDYVPMTRWTHIGIIVNDRYVQLTVDGNLYSSGTVDNYAASDDLTTRPMILPARGVLYIGGQPTVQGSMTRVEFANYPMTVKEIHKIYEALPNGASALSMLGLPQYGLRNPIYRLNT
jgi:hypothetical protein